MVGEELARLLKNMIVKPLSKIDYCADANPRHQDSREILRSAANDGKPHQQHRYERQRFHSLRQVPACIHNRCGAGGWSLWRARQFIDYRFEQRRASGLENTNEGHQDKGYREEAGIRPDVLEKYAEVFHLHHVGEADC